MNNKGCEKTKYAAGAPLESIGHGLGAGAESMPLKFHLGAARVKSARVACAGLRRYTQNEVPARAGIWVVPRRSMLRPSIGTELFILSLPG